MADVEPVAESEAGGEEEDEDDEEDDEPIKVKLLPGSTPTAASFEFHDEGHTLGNALRYVIMKNPDVEFCAYAIPHPSEPKMNVRIQTYGKFPRAAHRCACLWLTSLQEKSGTTAFQALEKGLRDIQELCDVVEDKFVAAREDFKARMSD